MFLKAHESDAIINVDHIIRLRMFPETLKIDGSDEIALTINADLDDGTTQYIFSSSSADESQRIFDRLATDIKTIYIDD